MSSAGCRVAWTRQYLNTLRALSKEAAAGVFSRLGPDWLATVEGASALAWIPFETHMAFLTETCDVLGRTKYRELARLAVYKSLDNPLLFAKPARAAMRLFGAGPLTVLRAVPTSIPYIYRDIGDISLVVRDPLHATLIYERFPPSHSGGDVWSVLWLGALDALIEYSSVDLHVSADISLRVHEPRLGHFEWAVSCQMP
jgi:hypothetical protein